MDVITGADLKKIVTAAAKALYQAKERINAMNVFPVPDGDTGINMALTLKSAVHEMNTINSDHISKVAAAIARGSLMGARGNSGVILSQFFRGLSDGLAKLKSANGKQMAFAFEQASKTTYKAVMKPVEGTMLSVGKAMAETCVNAVEKQKLSVEQLFEIAINSGRVALAETPKILPVLKQAGVVDAGGEGLLVVFEGGYKGLLSEEPLEELDVKDEDVSEVGLEHETSSVEHVLVNKYCTEFLIKGESLDVDYIRNSLEPEGDSMLVVGEDQVVKIHIHTNQPGTVLDFCSKLGDLTDIKIDNMKLQAETVASKSNNIVKFPVDSGNNETAEEKETGLVAVVPGEGLKDIFISLGVDHVIAGGQTMNPSTEQLVRAVEKVNAKSVIILPNNKNVIFSAQQVKEFADKKVEVVPTKTIPQGIAALIGYSPDDGVEKNISSMQEEIKYVRSGEITYAVRSTKAGELRIEEKDYIGLADGKIVVAGQSLTEVGLQLLDTIVDSDSSLISIYVGENQDMKEAEKFQELVKKEHKGCEVELYNGGQPLYYYFLSVE